MNAQVSLNTLDDQLVRQLQLMGEQQVKASVLLPAAQSALEHRRAMAKRMAEMAMELQALRTATELARFGPASEQAVQALRESGAL